MFKIIGMTKLIWKLFKIVLTLLLAFLMMGGLSLGGQILLEILSQRKDICSLLCACLRARTGK